MSKLRRSIGSTVGRVDDIREVCQALGSSRLVTLLGPGGVGKTTLAAEVAHELDPEFGRVVLAELVDAMDDGDLLHRVAAEVLSAPVHGGQVAGDSSIVDLLVAAVSVTPTLLVLDNCEHLVDDVADLVSDLLAREPDVRILTTSRRPLELSGEVLWTVRPLGLPSISPGPDAQPADGDLTTSTAVQLFLERTRQAVPSFELTAANRSLVARICAVADGVPLAIELAAALVRTRPLDQILLTMTEQPGELAGGRRDRAEHQRSLVASLDWSRRFLSEGDEDLLDRLAVFVGGLTAESAAFVAKDDDAAAGLARLVDHSLIDFDPASDRYRMLEVVRLDSIARLSPVELTAVEAGHTRACLSIVEAIAAARYDPDPEGVFPRYELELTNLVAALRRAKAADDRVTFRSLLGPVAVWWLHGRAPDDPAIWEEVFLLNTNVSGETGDDDADYPTAWRGNVLSALSFYWSHRGRHDKALQYARRAIDIHRSSDSLVELALDEVVAGNALHEMGDTDNAREAYHRGLEVAIESAEPYPEMTVRLLLARLDPDDPESVTHLTRARALASAGFGAIEAAITTEVAIDALRSERLDDARRLSELGIQQAVRSRYSEVYASALCGRAEVAIAEEEYRLADRLYREALGVGKRTVHEGLISRATAGLSCLPDGWDHRCETAESADVVELSGRELAVLRLLRGDMTQREIADELYIAPSTVKTHIKSIYRKLGVTKRSYAVTRANELELFR